MFQPRWNRGWFLTCPTKLGSETSTVKYVRILGPEPKSTAISGPSQSGPMLMVLCALVSWSVLGSCVALEGLREHSKEHLGVFEGSLELGWSRCSSVLHLGRRLQPRLGTPGDPGSVPGRVGMWNWLGRLGENPPNRMDWEARAPRMERVAQGVAARRAQRV